jgi:predicted transcriptional regulator|tara:strand:+ start:493 stop:696 length:204 start_codon:yes stop_codon:yes gene_type:complete
MSDLIRVENERNLYRDAKSGAIVNTDTFGYSQYISEKERRILEKKELEDVKNELSEIKKLLSELTKN